ncbi:MAG: hypothetical protein V4643_12045 [Bacteroidota bacterium]
MKITYLPILFLLILFGQGCKQENDTCCNPQKFNYFPISEAAIKKTPYFTNPAFDTLSFVSHEEDTITFVKTRTDSTWNCEYASGNPDNNTQNCYQILHNTYKTIRGVGSFDVTHSKENRILGLPYNVTDVIEIKFSNLRFVFFESLINDTKDPNYVGDFYIGNKVFPKTFFQYHNFNQAEVGKGYFSAPYGLIAVTDSVNMINWKLN